MPQPLDFTVEYTVSLYPSHFLGYHRKNKNWGEVKVSLPNLWNFGNQDFDWFVKGLNYIILLERICLERALQHIRLKNRCKPYPCKMEQITDIMFYLDEVLSSRKAPKKNE